VSTLAEHFLAELAVSQGLPRATLTPAARALMEDHSWPGNVRELKNVLERALVMCEGRELDARHLALGSRTATPRGGGTPVGGVIQVPSVGRTLRSVEAELVALTLSLTNWNKSAAARVLGISRPTLHRKIEEYGLAEPAAV
jgi:DNA-binding NtrC family response regulator